MHRATDAETDEALVLERVLLAVVGGVGVCAINVVCAQGVQMHLKDAPSVVSPVGPTPHLCLCREDLLMCVHLYD
jgi:hypothetical protein